MSTEAKERLLVEAGAGCGKTTSIINRFLTACKGSKEGGDGLSPSDIVLLTFTDAAANEMRQRLALKAGDLDLSHSHISTFHAYCLKLVKDFLPPHEKLMTEEEVYFLLKDTILQKISEHPSKEKVLELLSLRELFDLILTGVFTSLEVDFKSLQSTWIKFRETTLKTLNSLPLEDLAETDWPVVLHDRLQNNHLNGRITFSTKKVLKDIAVQYPELKLAAGVVRNLEESKIFTPLLHLFEVEEKTLALLFEFISSLQKDLPTYLTFDRLERTCLELLEQKALRVNTPKLLIVDEFQDTSPRQWKIIELISAPETNWYLVGDPKQSIYAFRKADLKIYKDLKQTLSVLELGTNYRSSPELLELFNFMQRRLFTTADDPDPQDLKAGKEAAHHLKPCRVFERPVNVAADILDAIKKREIELPQAHHGVLFREWKKLYEFSNYLHNQGIPYEVMGSEDLLDHPLAELFLNLISFIKNPKLFSPTLASLASPPLTAEKTLELSKNPDIWTILFFFVKNFQVERWPRGREWAAAFEKTLRAFEESNELSFARLEEVLQKGYYSSVKLMRPEHPNPTLKITLMTVHGSKGLEFDCLYLPDPRETLRKRRQAAEGEIPFQFPIAPQLKSRSLFFELKNMQRGLDRELEEKRLFYVAFTRAKYSIDFFVTPERTSARKDSVSWHELWDDSSNERFRWSSVIRALRDVPSVEWIESGEHAETVTPQWEVLPPLIKLDTLPDFTSSGVTLYLEGKKKMDGDEKKSASEIKALKPGLGQQDWGTSFHKALELWDGKEESFAKLPELVPSEHWSTIAIALKKVRGLKELGFYWTELAKPLAEQKVYREVALILGTKEYELSGQADVLIFTEKELYILDWKSSSGNFGKERIDSIRAQLRIYAQGFRELYPKTRLLSVGIETRNSYNARVLLNEVFS